LTFGTGGRGNIINTIGNGRRCAFVGDFIKIKSRVT
jgi:hypothetical protein